MKKVPQQVRITPEPMRGLQSLIFIDQILKRREICGVLIGGLSERSWVGNKRKEENKDIDVFILKGHIESVPGQWEYGVDWWLQSTEDFAPSNGTKISLRWALLQRDGVQIKPGLYIPSLDVIQEYRKQESGLLLKSENLVVLKASSFDRPAVELPVLDAQSLAVEIITTTTPCLHPKPFIS